MLLVVVEDSVRVATVVVSEVVVIEAVAAAVVVVAVEQRARIKNGSPSPSWVVS
jgi:hypothetical protein